MAMFHLGQLFLIKHLPLITLLAWKVRKVTYPVPFPRDMFVLWRARLKHWKQHWNSSEDQKSTKSVYVASVELKCWILRDTIHTVILHIASCPHIRAISWKNFHVGPTWAEQNKCCTCQRLDFWTYKGLWSQMNPSQRPWNLHVFVAAPFAFPTLPKQTTHSSLVYWLTPWREKGRQESMPGGARCRGPAGFFLGVACSKKSLKRQTYWEVPPFLFDSIAQTPPNKTARSEHFGDVGDGPRTSICFKKTAGLSLDKILVSTSAQLTGFLTGYLTWCYTPCN